jgi:hypothetical protein
MAVAENACGMWIAEFACCRQWSASGAHQKMDTPSEQESGAERNPKTFFGCPAKSMVACTGMLALVIYSHPYLYRVRLSRHDTDLIKEKAPTQP